MLKYFILSSLFFGMGFGDCYLHSPKGSNNRNNEKSANRANGNRLFDSQNNNRGGYNAPDLYQDAAGFNKYGFEGTGGSAQAKEAARNKKLYDTSESNRAASFEDNGNRYQYEEMFYMESMYKMTWTAQHGCGNEKNRCQMVLSWTCDTCHYLDTNCIDTQNTCNGKPGCTDGIVDGQRVQMFNGLNTGTSAAAGNMQNVKNTAAANRNNNRGVVESEESYTFCQQREREKGLFTADQKLQANTQKHTRQNPGGTRRGQECPQERDYVPSLQQHIWRHEAIFADDVDECEQKIAPKTMNTENRAACLVKPGNNAFSTTGNNIIKQKNKQDCEDENGVWVEMNHNVPKPACVKNKWSQVNNLGNVESSPDGGLPQSYEFKLPSIDTLKNTGCFLYDWGNTAGTPAGKKYARLQYRLRYNMSTTDYNMYKVDASCNQNKNQRVQSPVQQNPTVGVGAYMQGLRLAINTAQLGRTFQDRPHVFRVSEKPQTLLTYEAQRIQQGVKPTFYNCNVQGKRGNIVQTFPAVEYDFWPRHLEMKQGDCCTFQWAGSNTHNNGNPAGDGQAGDAGEGRGGSDRSNLMQVVNSDEAYPMPLDKFAAEAALTNTYSTCFQMDGQKASACATYMATGGYYSGINEAAVTSAIETNNKQFDPLLNNSPASLRPMTICMDKPEAAGKEFWFMSTRNDNFSNRDQKFRWTIKPAATGGR